MKDVVLFHSHVLVFPKRFIRNFFMYLCENETNVLMNEKTLGAKNKQMKH